MKIARLIDGFILGLAFFCFFGQAFFAVAFFVGNSDRFTEYFLGSASGARKIPQNQIQTDLLKVPLPQIDAKAVISVETNFAGYKNTLFEKSANTPLPIASLTKLMTAVVVLDNYNLADTWQVSATAAAFYPVEPDINEGGDFLIRTFLQIMLVGSSNRSAYALAEVIGERQFVTLMNLKAEEIGLKNTSFSEPTGLSPENTSTARDLAVLAEYIIKNYPAIAEMSLIKELYVPEVGLVKNTDLLLADMSGIVCGKTGFTKEASGCLLLVVEDPSKENYLVNVILGSDDRFAEMHKLVNWSSQACK